MTTETLNTSSGPYPGTGAVDQEFAVTFQSAGADQIIVYLDGVVVDTDDWSFARDADGRGTVTATLTGEVYIVSDPSFAQEGDFQRFGPYFPDDVNPHLDLAARRDQYLKAKVDTVVPDGGEVPGAGAGKFLARDAEGVPVFASGTGADAGLRIDLAATSGPGLIGWLNILAGAVARTLQSKLMGFFPLDAADFGVVADSPLGIGGTDNKLTLQKVFDAAAASGRPIHLQAGGIRSTEYPIYHTVGNKPGLNLRGAGRDVTTLWCDFDDARGIYIDGSSEQAYRFQFGGGIRDLSIKPVPGRTVTAGIEMMGWWFPKFKNLFIGHDDGTTYGITHGIYMQTHPATHDNPDGYAVVYVDVKHLEIRQCAGDGIRNRMGLGASNWKVEQNRIEKNYGSGIDNLGGEGWTVVKNSLSYNGWDPATPAGHGVKIYGTSSISRCTVDDNELDSNHTGGTFFSYVLWVECNRNRYISSRREEDNLEDRNTAHFTIDIANPCRGGNVEGNFHRVDLQTNDQVIEGFSSAVTFYNVGTGLTANLRGLRVKGWSSSTTILFQGITESGSDVITDAEGVGGSTPGFAVGQTVTHANFPGVVTITGVSGTGPYELTVDDDATADSTVQVSMTLSVVVTPATSALTNPANLNEFMQLGRRAIPDRTDFYAAGILVQDWTNVESPLIGNITGTGWNDINYYDPATGIYTMPFTGHLQFSCFACITATATTDKFYLSAYKDTGSGFGAASFTPQRLASLGVRETHSWGPAFLPVNQGDLVKFTVRSETVDGLDRAVHGGGTYLMLEAR